MKVFLIKFENNQKIFWEYQSRFFLDFEWYFFISLSIIWYFLTIFAQKFDFYWFWKVDLTFLDFILGFVKTQKDFKKVKVTQDSF